MDKKRVKFTLPVGYTRQQQGLKQQQTLKQQKFKQYFVIIFSLVLISLRPILTFAPAFGIRILIF
jgi:hypothetical protein